MDRALAQRHGAPYVHLVAFAIDVDRVHAQTPDEAFPFGWEVFLTEARVLAFMKEAERDPCPLLEDICLSVMEQPAPRGGALPAFGIQFPFAVYVATARGQLPPALMACFRDWKKPPSQLVEAVQEMEAHPTLRGDLARHCLQAPLSPPLVEPVRHSLLALQGL